ncbi:MAG: ABC-F family ATP-binding cassette domain-containing protein [Planctomycetota bacterium]|jgi:ATP-binding cassette subfamily F protein uup
MPPILSVRNLSKAFGSSVLFEQVNLHVEEGDRVGLIGPNGAGKSTLLKILAGLEEADDGEVVRRRGLRASFIAQDDRFLEGATPRSAVMAVAEADAGTAGGGDPATRTAIVLSQLGFEHPEQPVATLSGGWRKRLSLACGLVRDPDVLMLDEPTNHLDLEGVLWLEEFIRRTARGTTVMFITHDRRFLENVASRIVELSRAYPDGTLAVDGNYSEFVRRKAAFLEAQATRQSALANMVRQDTAWLRQGVKARETRNQSQVKAADARRAELASTRQRTAATGRATTMDFQATERKTRKLLSLEGVGVSMGGRRLFSDLEFDLGPGERLGLVGPNGAGKTTLLRLLAGDREPDEGVVRRADALRVVTFSQDRASLDPELTLHQALCPVGDFIEFRGTQVHVAGWAKRFLFDQTQLRTFVRHLSGGEQARVVIANLMLQPADVLLLDEPTNDLDIPSLEVLEDSLLEFPGAVVLVTHDRFMMERLATGYVGLDGRGGGSRVASLEQWLARMAAAEQQQRAEAKAAAGSTTEGSASSPAPAAPAASPRRGGRKLSYKEQREFDAMEETILAAEEEVARLEVASAQPGLATDHERARAAYEQLAAAQDRVAALYARWSELEAIRSGG